MMMMRTTMTHLIGMSVVLILGHVACCPLVSHVEYAQRRMPY